MRETFTITLLLLFTNNICSYAQVGINTSNPDLSAALDIQSRLNSPLGFLPPKINLASRTDASTIQNPATGLIVYNTNPNANNLREGLTLNAGSPSVPLWQSLTPESGVEIGKLVYYGTTTNDTKVLKQGGFEFKFTIGSDSFTHLFARLAKIPSSSVTISGNRIGWVGTATGLTQISQTWTTSDWSTWKQIDFMSNGASHFSYLRVSGSDQFYKITNFVNQNNFNSLIAEIY